MAHEGRSVDREPHFVDILKLYMMLVKSLDHRDDIAVVVDPGLSVRGTAAWDEDVFRDTDDLQIFQDHVNSALPFLRS